MVVAPLRAPELDALASPRARLDAVAPGAPLPDGCELAIALADGRRLAYVPAAPGEAAARAWAPDAGLRGNAFRVVHDTPRALAAELSIAAARRMASGPESERVFVILRGAGLVFHESGETERFAAGEAVFVPAGEAVRLWAQGPDDVHAVVLQPRMPPEPKRTLRGEVERLRRAR